MTSLHRLLSLALSALLLAGCSQAPSVQGETREEIDASLADLARHSSVTDPAAMQQAIVRLREVTALPDEERHGLPDPYQLIVGLSGEEFIRAMGRYTPVAEATRTHSDFPNGVLATNMLKLYQLQQGILQDARESALLSGRSVIDQFPIVDLRFTAPNSTAGMENDQATFRVSLLNNTRFDIYRPSFRVLVKDGAGQPLFERTFDQPPHAKDPIGPGETKSLDLVCCELMRDSYHNAMMRALPARATISASLIKVFDNSGRPVLETVAFTEADNDRLHFLAACIAYLTPRLETWVPPEDGNECLTLSALDEWESGQRSNQASDARTAALN